MLTGPYGDRQPHREDWRRGRGRLPAQAFRSARKLILRINNILRRGGQQQQPKLEQVVFGPYSFQIARRELETRCRGAETDRSRAGNPWQSSRCGAGEDDPAPRTGRWDANVGERNHRRPDQPAAPQRLKRIQSNPTWLQTVRGIGYRLSVELSSPGGRQASRALAFLTSWTSYSPPKILRSPRSLSAAITLVDPSLRLIKICGQGHDTSGWRVSSHRADFEIGAGHGRADGFLPSGGFSKSWRRSRRCSRRSQSRPLLHPTRSRRPSQRWRSTVEVPATVVAIPVVTELEGDDRRAQAVHGVGA